MKCIFCKEEKSDDQLSIEHVFPEALGGSYKIFSVCRDCNSELGREVDSHLANHPLVRLVRCELGLAGKKGNIWPFKGELVGSPADKKGPIKVTLLYDKIGGGLKGRVIPKLFDFHAIDDGVEWQKFVVDSEDMDNFVSMIQSFCRKHGQPQPSVDEISALWHHLKGSADGTVCRVKSEGVLFRGGLVKADPNIVDCGEDVDRGRCKRATVKIAYELACEWLGVGYLEDIVGEKLRRYVVDISFTVPPAENAVNGKIDIPTMPNSIGLLNFQPILYGCIRPSEGVLVCDVSICKLIRGSIIVSDTPERYPSFVPQSIEIDPITGQWHMR